jgi:transcriptional regulator with XRE-family HTH domain
MKNERSEKITPLSKDPAGIPRRMQQARIDRGLTLSQLSELSGASTIALSAIENGDPGYSLHDLNRARKALGVSLSHIMDGEERLKKAYSLDGEYWVIDWGELLDLLMGKLRSKNIQDLIGAEYFEGDQVPVNTSEMVDVDPLIDSINENAMDEVGEYAEDYPNLTKDDREELNDLIVSFLDKKHPVRFFNVIEFCNKKITLEDLEVAP